MYIYADYQSLYQNASALLSQAGDYDTLIRRISSTMHQTQEAWQGSDASAFLAKAESLQPQLNQMTELIREYASILSKTASTYETVQANRAAQTARLA